MNNIRLILNIPFLLMSSSIAFGGGSGVIGGMEESLRVSIREEVMLMERNIPSEILDQTLLENSDLVIMTAAKKLSIQKTGDAHAFKIDWQENIVEIGEETIEFKEILDATRITK